MWMICILTENMYGLLTNYKKVDNKIDKWCKYEWLACAVSKIKSGWLTCIISEVMCGWVTYVSVSDMG